MDEAGAAITCPTTGRTFPAVKRFELKTCTRCGGLIDIRFQAWFDGPYHEKCPQP